MQIILRFEYVSSHERPSVLIPVYPTCLLSLSQHKKSGSPDPSLLPHLQPHSFLSILWFGSGSDFSPSQLIRLIHCALWKSCQQSKTPFCIVCYDHHDKVPQTGCLNQHKFVSFFAFLEARSLRSGCCHGWFLKLHSLACRWTSFTCVFTWPSIYNYLCPNFLFL